VIGIPAVVGARKLYATWVRVRSPAAIFLAFGLLATLVLAARATPVTAEACKGGTHKTIEAGIVKAVGCWTEATKKGVTVYTGRWEDQPEGIDLNGFRLTGESGGALQIVPDNGEVKSVALSDSASPKAQLNSVNWPGAGEVNPLGDPIKLGFIAPNNGDLLLEDLHLGSNSVAGALAGLSPIGTVETPVRISEGGKGSMDLTIMLGGVFSLKGRPQSLTISLPTESEKGTKLDGFEMKLEKIDTFKVVTINDFEATYSAAKKLISGGANLTFPFSPDGKKGFGGSFALENGLLTELNFSAEGLEIPIGAPPGGFVTAIGGGFKTNFEKKEFLANARLEAELGPEVPTPWGKVAPIGIKSALQIGNRKEQFYFVIRGGVEVFRLDVGNVYLAIYGDSGVDFSVGLGVGFPSYRNNDRDPFYIGAQVGGWISKGHFQFEGKGRVALFSLKIFDGEILVNDRAAGACWKVLDVPGGAVYPYGTKVKTFGVGCGLDHYREKFPGSARVSSRHSQRFRLSRAEQVITVKGAGAPPRFTLRSAAGRTLRTPVDSDASIQRKGFRHAFFVNEETNTTHVVIPRPRGRWTITPYAGSAAITSLKAAREVPRERVRARVSGRGATRRLTWTSLDRPHTKLLFLEKMPGGREVPIFQTDRPSGSRKFRVLTGGHYGKRRLHVVVIHGYASRQSGVVDTYRVTRPGRLRPPQRVTGWRDEHDARVAWSGVRGAHGYLVEVTLPNGGKRLTNFVREVSANRRSLTIPHHPGGGRAIARVFALNRDGRLGRPAKATFPTGPPRSSLRVAARRSARTATRRGGRVRLRSSCPRGQHCRVVVELRYRGRVIARDRFQQTPDTFRIVTLRSSSSRARQAVRSGKPVRVGVRVRRVSSRSILNGAAAVP